MIKIKSLRKMKTSIISIVKAFALVLTVMIVINGCGGGGNKEKPAADTTSSAYTPASSPSAYDPTKIDATAPVMEVKLDAVGNSMDVMSFSTQEIKVKAGTTVKLHFTNTASDQAMKHNFFVVKNGTMEQ